MFVSYFPLFPSLYDSAPSKAAFVFHRGPKLGEKKNKLNDNTKMIIEMNHDRHPIEKFAFNNE